MQVIVLGAGLLGLTSAHHLQQLGHDVVVVDRHDTPGARVQRGERDRAAPVSTGFRRAPLWRSARRRLCGTAVWLDRTLRPEAGRHPVEQALRLRSYSREALRQIQADAGIPTSAPPPLPLSFGTGTMTFYTSRRAFARAAARAEQLRSLGSGRRLLSVDEALRIEPALRPIRHRLAGATWSVEREPGSPERIANALVALCRAAGVRFLMNHTLAALHEDRGRIGQIELRDASGHTRLLRADAYVLALGDDSAMHAASVGIDLALRPVREDRVTLPVTDADGVCRVPLRDHEAGLKFTRIRGDGADLLRVERTARAACGDGEHDAARFAAMVRHTQALFPGATDAAQAHFHTGLRAATPHDLPLIGRSRMRNLYLHVAHGPTDWIDACGSGKSIARIVSGLQPEFEFGFTGRECC